jgi:hypothetical protein
MIAREDGSVGGYSILISCPFCSAIDLSFSKFTAMAGPSCDYYLLLAMTMLRVSCRRESLIERFGFIC